MNNGPVTGGALQYPEYKEESWNFPEGDLAGDQRHRARLWLNYGVPRVDGLTLSVLQSLETGVPYGAGGLPIQGGNPNGINPSPYVTNPGYRTPPVGSNTAYFYTARDEFRLEGQKRTDFAANYSYNLSTRGRTVGIFVQAQVLNLFNQFQLCGCGANNVFQNGGGIALNNVDRTIQTPVTNPTTRPAFNPFTTTPVEGTNWAKGANVRKGAQPLRLHDAADVPVDVRRSFLVWVTQKFKRRDEGGAAKPRPSSVYPVYPEKR